MSLSDTPSNAPFLRYRTITRYPTTWQSKPVPAPIPVTNPAPVPDTPALAVVTDVPLPVPSAPTIPGFPGSGSPACVEGSTMIYNGDHGGWITIRCPHSCSECYGVKVHKGSGSSCTQSCVTPRALEQDDDWECGYCTGTGTSSFETVPREGSSAWTIWTGGNLVLSLSVVSGIFLLF